MVSRPAPAWSRRTGLADAELDGERVLWDPSTGQVARLDRIGSLVWACLDGVATLEDLTEDLSSVFAAPADAVRSDVQNLLFRLVEMGFVVEEPSQGPDDPDDPGGRRRGA